MTPEQAQDRFSEALEGTLSETDQRDFDDILRAHPEVRGAYERFRALFADPDANHARVYDEAGPDLLPGVQQKLFARSRGRFYRDRFARRGDRRVWFWVMGTVVTVLLLMALWLGVQGVSMVDSDARIEGDSSAGAR